MAVMDFLLINYEEFNYRFTLHRICKVQGKYRFLLFIGLIIIRFCSLGNIFISFVKLKISFLKWLHRNFRNHVSMACKLYDPPLSISIFSKAFGSNDRNSLFSLAIMLLFFKCCGQLLYFFL